ncbi:MAG: hypothetical protein ACHP7C_09745 [Lysobacterales bacterium]
MLLPNTPSSISLMPAAMPAATATMTPGEVRDDSRTHADYNLQPLLVKSLDHYVIPANENGRFHIR